MPNNEEIIIQDMNFGILIKNTLISTGHRDKSYGDMEFRKFKLSELQTITRLSLENGTYKDISALRYLTNLKQLSIKSMSAKRLDTRFSDEAKYNYYLNKNQIKDFSVIGQLSNLEFLTIENDSNIKSLDLTNLTKLAGLYLSNNEQLTELKGIDNLINLSDLRLFRNPIKTEFDLTRLFSSQLSDAQLDYDLYPMVKKASPNFDELASTLGQNGRTLRWVENLSGLRTNDISHPRMVEMQKEAEKILGMVNRPEYNELEKLSAIYYYILKNVKYDHEALKAKKDGVNIFAKEGETYVSSERLSTTYDRINSSYNAILQKKSVCEGYTNMMHYLLNCVGIDSKTVSCSSRKDTVVVGSNSDHSIIKVNIGGDWYYFDPTWDAEHAKKGQLAYFFKTKKEISDSHRLSISEEDVRSPIRTVYSKSELSETFKQVIEKRGYNSGLDAYKARLQAVKEKLRVFRGQYAAASSKMEELMKQNSHSGIADFDIKLRELMQERDEASRKIDSFMSQENAYEKIVSPEKRKPENDDWEREQVQEQSFAQSKINKKPQKTFFKIKPDVLRQAALNNLLSQKRNIEYYQKLAEANQQEIDNDQEMTM